VQLILSDLCNHDCVFCAYRISEGFSSEQFGEDTGKGFTMNPNRRISTAKALEIVQDLAAVGVPAVQFTGGGEPTVHPDHLSIFRSALDQGLEVALVSNGSKLASGWQEVLPRMSWIRISIDAGSAATYSVVRRVPKTAFGKTLKNLETLAREIKWQQSNCALGCSFIVTNENYQEIVEAAQIVKEAGAKHLRIAACYTTKGTEYYRLPLERYQEEIARAQACHQDPTFEVVNMFASRAEDLLAQSPDFSRCGYQQLNVYIAGNLRIYRCCTTSYTPHGEVGDLRARSFKDWLLSADSLRLYQEFDAHTCRSCPFAEKNRVINYMLDDRPTHINFV
jgi:MoaA/NifB/PqqE/SkfB family radical SAM enzyme